MIYIPIWLDLLFETTDRLYLIDKYLHSNMVRFIIGKDSLALCQLFRYLHSNMVRFIIFIQIIF